MRRVLGNEGHQDRKPDLCLEKFKSKTQPLAAEGASATGRTVVLLPLSCLCQCPPSRCASQWSDWTSLKIANFDHCGRALSKTSACQPSYSSEVQSWVESHKWPTGRALCVPRCREVGGPRKCPVRASKYLGHLSLSECWCPITDSLASDTPPSTHLWLPRLHIQKQHREGGRAGGGNHSWVRQKNKKKPAMPSMGFCQAQDRGGGEALI